jgi:hypothetical protein
MVDWFEARSSWVFTQKTISLLLLSP